MRPKDNHARPIVLRELSLLRALGASRRTFRYRPGKPGVVPLSLAPLPQADALASMPPLADATSQRRTRGHESPLLTWHPTGALVKTRMRREPEMVTTAHTARALS